MHHASKAQKRAGALPPELRLTGLGIHAGLLPPQAAEWTAQWREKKARGEGLAHWIFAVMGFFGSQLLVWPLLALVGFLFWNMLSVPLVRLAIPGALLATGAFMLRPPVGMAHAQIGFAVLQAGLVALYLSLMTFGIMGPEDGLLPDTLGLIFLAVLTASAALAGPAWTQALLAAQATVVALGLFGRWTLFHDGFLSWSMGMPVYAINAAVLALAWAVLVASEGRVPGRHWLAAVQARCSPALTGMGVALVLCVAQVNASHFFTAVTLRKLASGSAEAGALAVPLLHLGLGAALQLALTLAAAGWLMRHWRLRQAGARSLGLFALAYSVLLLACFFIPLIGVVTLVGTVALGTHRRRLLALGRAPGLLARLELESLALGLLHKLLAADGAAPAPAAARAPRHWQRAVDEALHILHAEWSEPLTIARLARRAGINECYLKEMFRQRTGQTIAAYLRALRMGHALRLLESGQATLQQAAHACGYSRADKFSQAFRRVHGVMPSQVSRQAAASALAA